MEPLRRIAVWVDETDSGGFRWVLTEVDTDRSLHDIDSSVYEFASYEGALREGADALARLSDDPVLGPRVGDPARIAHA